MPIRREHRRRRRQRRRREARLRDTVQEDENQEGSFGRWSHRGRFPWHLRKFLRRCHARRGLKHCSNSQNFCGLYTKGEMDMLFNERLGHMATRKPKSEAWTIENEATVGFPIPVYQDESRLCTFGEPLLASRAISRDKYTENTESDDFVRSLFEAFSLLSVHLSDSRPVFLWCFLCFQVLRHWSNEKTNTLELQATCACYMIYASALFTASNALFTPCCSNTEAFMDGGWADVDG